MNKNINFNHLNNQVKIFCNNRNLLPVLLK